MKTNTVTILNATTMAGTTKVISSIVPLSNIYCMAYQYISAGTTGAGSLQFYVSLDEGLNEQGDGVVNWAVLDSAITIPGTIGTTVVNKDGIAYRWLKAEYTPNNGTGTLTVKVSVKG